MAESLLCYCMVGRYLPGYWMAGNVPTRLPQGRDAPSRAGAGATATVVLCLCLQVLLPPGGQTWAYQWTHCWEQPHQP